MEIYNYNPTTKEYISEGTADKSPLENDVYLLPANATFLEPPSAEENETAVFENDSWAIKADYRGKTYYSKDTKEAITINELGTSPDETMTDLIPGEFDKWNPETNGWTEDPILVSNAQQERINKEARKFLDGTDWKMIRHRDQLALGIQASLTNEEYIELLNQRQEARNKVVE